MLHLYSVQSYQKYGRGELEEYKDFDIEVSQNFYLKIFNAAANRKGFFGTVEKMLNAFVVPLESCSQLNAKL